ncbi:MAG: hypothetical protein R3F19_12720 [Verrucomicrobiales bacterium]
MTFCVIAKRSFSSGRSRPCPATLKEFHGYARETRIKDEVESAFAKWVGHDSVAAAQWWRSAFSVENDNGTTSIDDSTTLAFHMSLGIAKEAPELAIELSERFRRSFPQRMLRMEAFNTWLEQSPKDAYRWAAQLRSPTERFDRAWQMQRIEAHSTLFGEEWRGFDDVMDWALAFTPPDQQSKALADVLGYWGGMGNLENAAEWLINQPEVRQSDFVIKSLATVKRMKPATAINLASKISDDAERELLMSGIYRRWHLQHSKSAADFLNNGNLTAEQLNLFQRIANDG